MPYPPKEISTIYGGASRDNDIGMSISIAYDSAISGFRTVNMADLVNLNLNSVPTIYTAFAPSSGISNSTPSTGTNTTGLLISGSPSLSKKGVYIQNLSSNPLYILFGGNGQPNLSNFNVLLFGSGQTNSIYQDSSIHFTGNYYGSGQNMNCIAWAF